MRFASSVSEADALEVAVGEVEAALAPELDAGPDLVFAFVSDAHAERYEALPELLARAFPRALTLGCSARSVIGAGRELEERPGLALVAASLPGVELRPLHVDAGSTAPLELPAAPRPTPHFVLLADPFSAPTEQVVQLLDAGFPEAVKIGGLASGGRQPGENALFLGGEVLRSGLVGVALAGDIVVDPIVAQGCRPIGAPLFVTRHDEGLLLELDGRPALEVLREVHAGLAPGDRELFRSSLFVGLVMRDDQSEYRQGDFLIRNLVGIDAESGAVAVAADLSGVRVVQLHLRDARTSAEDLAGCLARYAQAPRSSEPAGALLFSCLGRGAFLYGEPDHDSRAFAARLGRLPLGGFFCNGEIGPVQRRTYLHGYTSSFGIFRPGPAEG